MMIRKYVGFFIEKYEGTSRGLLESRVLGILDT